MNESEQKQLRELAERHYWQKSGLSDFDMEMLYTHISSIIATREREREEDLVPIKNILTYIATRNDLHNAVCIPKAKEALEILALIQDKKQK